MLGATLTRLRAAAGRWTLLLRSATPRTGRSRRERGSVTAEAALVLPVLVLLLTVAVGTVSAVTAQMRCVDAAREAARAVARGESLESGIELAARAAPAGARIRVDSSAERIVVTVTAEVPIGGGLLPAVTVSGEAVARPEPTGPDPPLMAGSP